VTDDDGPLPARVEVEPAPEHIAELAENCRQYVLAATGIELDYSEETLPVLDHYMTLARESIRERPELLPLVTRAAGAYFGELVRRKLTSFWRLPTGDDHDWRLCARDVYLSLNPIGAAYDALAASESHQGPSSEIEVSREERELVARRLELMPPVPEDEYFLFCTRLEVIEVSVMALRLEMQREGLADVRFDDADYAAGPSY
jgi:hypothetical protein